MKSSRTFLSPAKVNLILRVLRKRVDGYHDILSVMQKVSVYDEISINFENGDGVEVTCNRAEVPVDSSNLAFKAALAFLERAGTRKFVKIDIKKNIPVAAGLGGGSSNAATVLSGLNSLLETGFNEEELMGIAATLGSDAPFFILKGPALATGRGEVLERVKLPEFHYVLINPGFPVSTAWVYNNLDLTKTPEDNILFYSEEAFAAYGKLKEFLVNDLEAVTIRRFPEIRRIKEMLLDNGALTALMSGSGPTVFGIFPDARGADRAFGNLKKRLDIKASIFRAEGLCG